MYIECNVISLSLTRSVAAFELVHPLGKRGEREGREEKEKEKERRSEEVEISFL